MKAIISHPATTIISFFFILISGQHLGGFYLLYILLGLPHGAAHSILALIGVSLLVICHYIYKRQFRFLIEPILNIAGAMMLILSIFWFSYKDEDQYNFFAFYQTIPLIVLIAVALIIIGFLMHNILKLRSGYKQG